MSNIYAAPTANFSDSDSATETKLFEMNGRIGRVRWIAYMGAMWFLSTLFVGIALQLVALGNRELVQSLDWVLSLAIVIVMALVSRRRLQDFGLGAVYLLGAIIPFVNLYFFFMMIFKRGDEGNNEFGPSPAPNNRKVYLLVSIYPAIVVIGILAAIAIPAYQSYKIKARAAEPTVLTQPQR